MEIKPLPQVPILPPDVDKSSRTAFIDVYNRVNQLIKELKDTIADVASKAPLANPVFTDIVTIAGQLKFPNTQNASTDPNILDDYEEGTWTPTFTCANPGNISITYATRIGTYTKIGRHVTVGLLIATSAFTYTTASGIVSISGLPFIASGLAFVPIGAYKGFNSSGYTTLGGQLSGTASIYITKSGSGLTYVNAPITDFPSGGSVAVYATLTYFV